MHTAISEKRDELIAICRRYDVARLEVFGSAARGTDFDPERSDVDFFVEFKPDSKLNKFGRYFDMLFALEEALGCPVDLARRHLITNPYMKESMTKYTEVVYEDASAERAN